MKISKELFIRCIDTIEKCYSFSSEVDKVFREYKVDGYWPGNIDCSDVLMDLLDVIFTPDNEDEDVYDNVFYFCCELNFGKNVREAPADDPWIITDADGKDISGYFVSADKLYDYLVSLE